MDTRYRVGCSGWSYRHWRGDFYPAGLAATRWFQHYSGVFDTVELNGTFYRLPSERAVSAWREQAPEGFRFSAKVSRLITHFRRLRDCEAALRLFHRRLGLLGTTLGPLLYQLPPDLERDTGRLRDFLGLLPSGMVHAFEFRNRGWWCDEVWRLLSEHGAAFCVYDMGETRTPCVVTGDVLYMRFHGHGYSGAYSDDALREWAARIRDAGAKEAWLYFNNDIGGHAPRDALRLRAMLRKSGG
jgi:uncharacterized protein YecE (DUF72 family)